MSADAKKVRDPSINEMLQVLHEAVQEFSQAGLEHREIETTYHDESETLTVQVMHDHHVDIYKVEMKYDMTYSG
ncbi:MAG: hypothetical protein H0U60_19615 [Blastocatellia bacterium]|nr:hypothetical protein [Blastocatellia bacterium]